MELVILSLCLFATTLFFAFLYVKKDFATQLKTQSRRHIRDIKALKFTQSNEIQQIRQLIVESVKTTSPRPNSVIGSETPFEKMQSRVEKELGEVVVVNNEEMRIPRIG